MSRIDGPTGPRPSQVSPVAEAKPATVVTAPKAQAPIDGFAPASGKSPIEILGVKLERLDAPANRTWLGTFGQRALDAAYTFYDGAKVGQWVEKLFHQHDSDAPQEVQAALAAPIPKDSNGQPKSFGDVTVLVSGMLNLPSTPAAMFRLAQLTKGPLVIASSNPGGADGYRLRPLTELYGAPVPPELQGKLFAIGDLSPNMLPWPQGSDLMLEHLAVLDAQFAQLKSKNPALQGFSQLSDAELTVVGYSQGAVSAAAARKRLDDAGRPQLIDRVVSVAGAFEGTTFADGGAPKPKHGLTRFLQAGLARVLGQVNHTDGRRTLGSMDPDYLAEMKKQLGLRPELVDVAYVTNAEAQGPRGFTEPFFELAGKLIGRATGQANDGVVGVEQPFGRKVVRDETPKTHLALWKDFRTFDRILEGL